MKTNKKSSKKIQIFIIVLFVLFLAIQFVPAKKSNPVVINEINLPSNVKTIIKRSCYDCHSNETVWPWYSNIAPVSWLVVKDVNEGREHLNFSEWNKIDSRKQDEILEEIWEEISQDKMPMGIYTLMHSDARLSDNDKQIIKNWIHNNKRLWN